MGPVTSALWVFLPIQLHQGQQCRQQAAWQGVVEGLVEVAGGVGERVWASRGSVQEFVQDKSVWLKANGEKRKNEKMRYALCL